MGNGSSTRKPADMEKGVAVLVSAAFDPRSQSTCSCVVVLEFLTINRGRGWSLGVEALFRFVCSPVVGRKENDEYGSYFRQEG